MRYYDVKSIQLHQGWISKGDKREDDIALLTLTRPIDRRLKVGKVALPRHKLDYPARGENVMAIGWGLTQNKAKIAPSRLQGAPLRIHPLLDYGLADGSGDMPATKICVDASVRSVCNVRGESS